MMDERLATKVDEIKRLLPPSSDICVLVSLVEQKPFHDEQNPDGNSKYYILDRILGNGLGYIPGEFSDLRKGYYDLGCYYLGHFKIEEKSEDPVLKAVSEGLPQALHILLDPSKLPSELGRSPVYLEVAREIMNFYERNKDNIDLLIQVSDDLFHKYLYLDTAKKDPAIIRTVWDEVRKKHTSKK